MESDRNEQPAGEHTDAPKVKKVYEKPSFTFERAFETMALSCGKLNSTQAQCKFNKKAS